MPVLLLRPAFIAAVHERIDWLAEHRSEDQLDSFLAGLGHVRDRLKRYPEAGSPVKQDATHVLRMRLFPRPLPYLVYYGQRLAHPIDGVYLVRLYGSGQHRPELDMSDWPW